MTNPRGGEFNSGTVISPGAALPPDNPDPTAEVAITGPKNRCKPIQVSLYVGKWGILLLQIGPGYRWFESFKHHTGRIRSHRL
jgi:hypothetical protein